MRLWIISLTIYRLRTYNWYDERTSNIEKLFLLFQEDMVCLSCTGTGERVCLAAEGFGNRQCFLEGITDRVSIVMISFQHLLIHFYKWLRCKKREYMTIFFPKSFTERPTWFGTMCVHHRTSFICTCFTRTYHVRSWWCGR